MNTTQINNKHYIECDVVMLTTDVSNRYNCTQDLIVKCIKSWTPIGEDEKKVNRLSISKNWSEGVLEYYQPQHLYILSNEDIKVGDWKYDTFHKQVTQVKNIESVTKYDKKVISATDSSLFKKEKTSTNKHSYIYDTLPQIPQLFIEHFINEYNKGNIVNKGMVQVVDNGEEDWMGDDYTGEPVWNSKWEIKLNQNNEISILIPSEKETFTRQEMLNEFKRLIQLYTTIYVDGDIEEWIKNNLKTK